jgi:hypothetical protein
MEVVSDWRIMMVWSFFGFCLVMMLSCHSRLSLLVEKLEAREVKDPTDG